MIAETNIYCSFVHFSRQEKQRKMCLINFHAPKCAKKAHFA